METRTVTVYEYHELSEEARELARQNFAEVAGYMHADEAFESLKVLTEFFGGKLGNYGIDYFDATSSWAEFLMPDMEPDEIQDLLTYLGGYNPETLRGFGDCELTGYCADEDAIDGFRRAFLVGRETDLEKLMQAAFDTWLEAAQDDCESEYSDEAFGGFCEANEYRFYESGKLAPRVKP